MAARGGPLIAEAVPGAAAAGRRAPGSGTVQPHDPLERVDAAGRIATGAHRARFPPAFRPLLEQAAGRMAELAPGASLYVYGSVATGLARLGHSDVDLVTIGLGAAEARGLAAELAAAHRGLCRGVEIGAAQQADYQGHDDEAHGNRVFLRHYCVHLAGPDPAQALPDYPADAAAARGFNGDIGLRAEGWRAEADRADPAALARRLARKTLFAVAGLVSVHDTVWTTDRLAAARRWAEIEPALAPGLARLVHWAFDTPVQPGQGEVQAALAGVVAQVVAAFEQRIGLWRARV